MLGKDTRFLIQRDFTFRDDTMKKILIIIGAVLVVGAGIYYWTTTRQTTTQETQYQTTAASRGTLSAVVGATGTIAAKQSITLNWETSGTVESVAVQVGDVVAKGKVLARLQDSSLPESVIMAKSDLLQAQKDLENLEKSRTGLAQAELDLAQAQATYDDAEETLQRKKYRRVDQNTLDTLRADYIIAEDAVEEAEDDFSEVEDREEDDPIRANVLSKLAEARMTRDKALANLNYALGLPEANELAEAQANVKLAYEKLEDAKRAVEELQSGIDQQALEDARARVSLAKATMKQAWIEAPFDGTITQAEVLTGDVVSSNDTAFRLDDISHLVVDVDVSEVDINRVKVGQPAVLTFDAIQDAEYQGKVMAIERIGTTSTSGVTFKVKVEMTSVDDRVLPGMTAAVNITVFELKDVMKIPTRAIRAVNGSKVVYILNGTAAQMVHIELGAASDTETEVKGDGLKEGDLVILNPPSTTTSSGGPGGGGPPPDGGGGGAPPGGG